MELTRPTARALLIAALAAALTPALLAAQWTNRYPRVAGFGHHVYLEGYELPTLSSGPIDPAPSPDGRSLAFASRGWLWLLDLESGQARRLTSGAGMDSRPVWSPSGRELAFVRDDTRSLSLVLLELATGRERILVDDPVINLDPAFSPDGRFLYFSSAVAGDLDLWRLELQGGARTRLTEQRGLELRPQPHPDGRRLLYLSKAGGVDVVRVRDLETGEERTLRAANIASQLRPALSPDGRTVAFGWPTEDHWELRLMDLEDPQPSMLLTPGPGKRLTPAWSSDGALIYFSQADERQRMVLWRVPAVGGEPVAVPVRWDWGAPTARLRVVTTMAGEVGQAPARLHVRDAAGHPLLPEAGQPRFDGQTGRVFFYSPGTLELEIPAGEVEVLAVQGLATPERAERVRLAAGETREVRLELTRVWDARAAGWRSGDHHFHLNYGGPYQLEPDDLLPMLRGENVDVVHPLVANLHNRLGERDYWGWERTGEQPLIGFGQEVRSHFLGHVSLVGTDRLFWPWIWGPGYQVYGRDDRTNAEALRFGRAHGGFGTYVHPVSRPDPFGSDPPAGIPLELIPDAVLGDLDAIELVCLWSDERGTAEVWHRLLNLGIPIVPSAGTDVMTDFYRTMAVGTTRVYVRPEGAFDMESYLAALRAGRSFATTGPMLDFRIGEVGPGGVVQPGELAWSLDLHSAMPVERVEILVNGEVVWSGAGLERPGSRTLTGRVRLPAAGWVAARAHGGEITAWPGMGAYAFAHTSPTWIGRVGSSDPAAARTAAADLLRALDAAEARLVAGYAGTEIPVLRERFRLARQELERRR